MLVNFDERLNMRDLFYPRVGMTNHILGHQNALGVWVDGRFSWVHADEWVRRSGYEEGSLIGFSTATNPNLGVSLLIEDAVHFREDLFVKRIRVVNLTHERKEVRLFFSHDFCIDESDIGDTSLYDPGTDSIIHYKRDKWFLMSGNAGDDGIYQYANGRKRFSGAEGTWRDAEDGWLEGNPIAQGSVDSCLSFRIELPPEGERAVDYWIAAGRNLEDVRRVHRKCRKEGIVAMIDHTRAYWRSWLGKRNWETDHLSEGVMALVKRSLLIIRTQIDRGGAILAANDSDILHFNRDDYSYMWPRDGALVAYTLDRAGYSELTKEFYLFCRRGLSSGGFLWHKYHPDGSIGSSWHPWLSDEGPQLPIQEDETALVLYALWHFYEQSKEIDFVEGLYQTLIKPAAGFLAAYRDRNTGLPLESYDLWEERRGIFTFTASAVWAGLTAAAKFAELFGDDPAREKFTEAADEVRSGVLTHLYDASLQRFVRGVHFQGGELVKDTTLESSICGVHEFGLLPADDPRVVSSMHQIEEGLRVKTWVGGYARYENDPYFSFGNNPAVPGNPWINCTLWVADWHIAKARSLVELQGAKETLEWVVARAMPSGVLPEQLHPETGAPLSVAPLTWSHSTFVQTAMKYLDAAERLTSRLPAGVVT